MAQLAFHEQSQADISFFRKKLASYRIDIDAEIRLYTQKLRHSTIQTYGASSLPALEAYLQILSRGGKRLRGALTILGYEMCGGMDASMIIRAARAVEMLHAYLLVIDDIQDRSALRRGGPAAHEWLRTYHDDHGLKGDPGHFGMSLALQGALTGAHQAQLDLVQLVNTPKQVVDVLAIVQRTMVTTCHGQANDIMNEVLPEVDTRQVKRVLEWKTAHYTFLNPLHIGMALAGAPSHDRDMLYNYAMNIGVAFQISDDILGTFGDEQESGKSPMDDTREGKRTVLSTYAFTHTSPEDKHFLSTMLGNREITPQQFEHYKSIVQSCGALEHAHAEVRLYAQRAIMALQATPTYWEADGNRFLAGLAEYILIR